MRETIVILLIRSARKLTRWGFTDDYLSMAEAQEKSHKEYIKNE